MSRYPVSELLWYRLGFRDVAQPRDERSLIATLIPPNCVCGDKVPTIDFAPDLEWAYLPWLINTLCKGALGQLQNHFLPTHKLEKKVRRNGRTTRVYGDAQTPLARVLAAPQVLAEKKAQLQTLHARLNPFQLHRDIERQKKEIEAHRRFQA